MRCVCAIKSDVFLSRRGSRAIVAIAKLLGRRPIDSFFEGRNCTVEHDTPVLKQCERQPENDFLLKRRTRVEAYSPKRKRRPKRAIWGVPRVRTGVFPTSIARSKRFSPAAKTSR